MSIEILPAQLANQIAAGEVVERPASVVKELIENSLDAGATSIKIDIEKGGAKRIRIYDNGSGIAKEQLTLALSRHATSKIKNLKDLEGIASLGFRGEALASISSVSRLTLTSKPAEQSNAWQAMAQGRDMQVDVQPAAHTNGTTIDVVDLFFNTPARRKFMRTEKTEFSHIDEVIKRIALARFDVAITLTHNDKTIRQYRLADNENKRAKRVAQVCGQSFIDHALEVECQHDGLRLWGWIAKPSFVRAQNDLCYSYVNGRMMRDKLINHAIRQSYQEMLTGDGYPAFVLFLTLDVRDVDVNVHPAKHEVRFHQGRYVHDFIYTVCHRALVDNLSSIQQSSIVDVQTNELEVCAVDYQSAVESLPQQANNQVYQQVQEVIQPLRFNASSASPSNNQRVNVSHSHTNNISEASTAYQALMTPAATVESDPPSSLKNNSSLSTNTLGQFIAPHFVWKVVDGLPRLANVKVLSEQLNLPMVKQRWADGFVSQPLLLPVQVKLSENELHFINNHIEMLEKLGITIRTLDKSTLQIRQFPALLRQQNVIESFTQLIQLVMTNCEKDVVDEIVWQQAFSQLLAPESYDQLSVNQLLEKLYQLHNDNFDRFFTLNSVAIDLTSAIQELESP